MFTHEDHLYLLINVRKNVWSSLWYCLTSVFSSLWNDRKRSKFYFQVMFVDHSMVIAHQMEYPNSFNLCSIKTKLRPKISLYWSQLFKKSRCSDPANLLKNLVFLQSSSYLNTFIKNLNAGCHWFMGSVDEKPKSDSNSSSPITSSKLPSKLRKIPLIENSIIVESHLDEMPINIIKTWD